jgi:hypothetical protein
MDANMFDRVLTSVDAEEPPEDCETFYDEISSGVLELGFYIQQF